MILAALAQGDARIASVVPVLRHLVTNDESSFFSEEVVARCRAMIDDLSRQLLFAHADAVAQPSGFDFSQDAIDAMARVIAADAALLGHVHALAVEWQLAERLQNRLGLDPVLSPLLQALVASSDPVTASSAMSLLAAQARFAQSQRRMQLPLAELPADGLHAALQALRIHAGEHDEAAAKAERSICEGFDESRSRIGLLARTVMAMGGGAHAALLVDHAGVALMLTAVSLATGLERRLVSLSTHEGQATRFALGLTAAGLKSAAVERQVSVLHPEISLPPAFAALASDRAASILGQAFGYSG
jgi:hypothetical protein